MHKEANLTLTLSRSRSTKDHHLNKLSRPTAQMLYTKCQGHRPSGYEEDFKRVNTIYGRGSHLGHKTKIFCMHFSLIIIRSLHIKFEFNWTNGL